MENTYNKLSIKQRQQLGIKYLSPSGKPGQYVSKPQKTNNKNNKLTTTK